MGELGDLWHIIGASIVRFGLSIYDTGLHLRIEEIEQTNRKDALLRLTSRPGEMMRFLGLDEGRYVMGFGSLDEVFGWVVECRYFRRRVFERKGVCGKEMRVREKRVMYKYLVLEWLPRQAKIDVCDLMDDGDEEVRDRAWGSNMREEALEVFGKRMEYERLLKGMSGEGAKE